MQSVLTPFLLALLGAYLLNPLIALFEQRGIRRKAVVILFYLVVGAGVTWGATRIVPAIAQEIQELQANWPERMASLKTLALNWGDRISRRIPGGRDLLPHVEKQAQAIAGKIAPILSDLISNLLGFFSLLFLVPFIGFFLMVEGPSMTDKVLTACPSRHVETVLNLFCSISESLGNYLRALFLDAAIIGVLAAMGLYLLGVEYALVLGAAAGISGLIPYIGPLLVGAISAGLAMVQFQAWGPGLHVLLLFVGLRFVDDWALQPFIMSKAADLHPVILLLALMIGGHFFGLLGLILAAPTACVLHVILETIWDWYQSQSALRRPPMLPEEKLLII